MLIWRIAEFSHYYINLLSKEFMLYDVNIKARVESDLSKNDLEKQLVVALHNTDNQYSKFDGVDSNLEVSEYELTEAEEVCL